MQSSRDMQSSREMIEEVARRLGPLREHVTFLGGAVITLLVSDPAAPDLLVQYAPVGDHQHGVKDGLLGLRGGEFYELVGKPGERIGLAGACRVLHQIPQARAVLLRIG